MEEERITVLEKNAPALKLSSNDLKQLEVINKQIVSVLQQLVVWVFSIEIAVFKLKT